jgi:hypothetical protein
MTDATPKALRAALKRAGWTILLEHPGDDREITGSWKLGREDGGRLFWLVFDRQDHVRIVPISKRGFALKDRLKRTLHVRTEGGPAWKKAIADFVASLRES